MRKLGKAQKIGITCAVLCCALLAIVFSADYKKLFASVTDALNALTGTEATMTVDSMVVMNTEDAQQTDDYYAFGVYAPSTATYTIGVTAENGKVRVNTGEATAIEGTEVSVSLTEGTNVLYFVDCTNPSIQWDSEECDLEPVNKVCMPLSGDANQSGERTVEDLVLIKKEAAASGSSNIERTEIADIDRDDSVTNEDASQLRTLLVGNPEYKVAERSALIVDAYIEETGTLYDTLAEAVAEASEKSVSDSKSVTVTVLNPKDVKLTAQIPVQGGAQIILQDDGSKDGESVHNGWCRTITRDSTLKTEMFAVGDATLTLTGSSESDERISLLLDGGAIPASSNHIVDVGNQLKKASAIFNMNAGVKITNNVNTGAGGALAATGTFNMNGGIISGNIANGVGGGVHLLSGAQMNMSGGIITENETTAELYSSGGVNISGGATLIMTGGEIYGNITPISLDNNGVRVSKNCVLKMEGEAYIDRVCIDATFSDTPCIELTGALTADKETTLFFTQPMNQINAVVKGAAYYEAGATRFVPSERVLPFKLEEVGNNDELYLRSDIEGMETVTAKLVYNNEKAFTDINNEWVVQGVCADDTYLYAAIAHNVDGLHKGCRILKVDLTTSPWTQVAISDVLPTDHSNEMTYNIDTGRIYITHCTSSGAFEGTTDENGAYAISVVDPETLTIDTTVGENGIIRLSDETTYTGKTGIYALAYNAAKQYYVAGATGFRFGFLKGAENTEGNYEITECAMPSTGMVGFTGYTGYIKQGVYANDTTIYTNTWYDIAGEEKNFITMYDWTGNYNGTKYVVDENGNVFTHESESMFEYKGKMYAACFPESHTGVEIYELSDVGTAVSTIDVKDSTGTVVDGVYTNLADAIAKANELGTATIVLKDDVTIGATQTVTGNVIITDDGTKRTLQRSTGCTEEMFNVAGGAELTFTGSSMDDNNPMLVIDGNKEKVTTTGYAPVVDMDQTNGILNITPGVIVQNNMSHHAGGVIFAGLNGAATKSGGQATINITGGLFTGNEISYTNNQWLFGGVIYIESGCTLNISNATFENTKMAQNCTDGMTYGGVIAVRTNASHLYDDANVTIENCIFENTTVTQKGSGNGGGVLYIGTANNGNVQIIDCEFTGNSTEGLGGAIFMTNTLKEFILSGCTFSDNKDVKGTNDIYMASGTTVNVSGNMQANINCTSEEQIHVPETLGTDSVIRVTMSSATAGTTVATFATEDIMTACQANGYLKVTNEDYALNYATSGSTHAAKLASVVAVIGEEKYASLAEAIEAANVLESVTIVLKADVTVDATQEITGNVTITDDGTSRTITREEGFTDQMFVVADGAGLTFTATGEDKTSPTLTIDGNGEVTGASQAMVSLGAGSGTLTVNNAVQFTNANISEDGGIIRTEDGSTAIVTINGGVFANNTAERAGDVYGGLINVLGTANVTISNAIFQENAISSTSKLVKGGMLYVNGGTLNVVGSEFTSNTAYTTTAGGGLIRIDSGTLNIGKYVNEDKVTIEDACTFTSNAFSSSTGKRAYGGVLAVGDNASAQVYNSTFNLNTADYGGTMSVNKGATLTVGNCTLSDNIPSEVEPDSKDIRVTNTGKVVFEGKVNTTVYCNNSNTLKVNSQLTEGSQIIVTGPSSVIKEGNTVVTFASGEIMTDCKTNGYLKVTNEDYALNYATSGSTHAAKLASVVAVIGEEKYASLADAIEAANALDGATIVLKADVMVDAIQEITGNVTITDDGTARTITRDATFTGKMFVVDSDASFTLEATGTDKDNPSLTIDGNQSAEGAGASEAMISLGTGSGTLTVNNAVQFTNANISEDGGIIRTEDGSTATVTINGGVFANNTVSRTDNVLGGLINVLGTANVTISDALFQDNNISSEGAVKGGIIYVGGGTANIVGSTYTSNTVDTTNTGAGGVLAGYGGTLNIGKYVSATEETIEGDCFFTDNIFTGSSYGGAITVQDGSVQVYNSTIQRNDAKNGGGIHVPAGKTITIGDCTITENTTKNGGESNGSARLDINANGTVDLEGMVKTTIFCGAPNRLFVTAQLEAESEIKVGVLKSSISEGDIVVTFGNAEIMTVCEANENFIFADYESSYAVHEESILDYETTSASKYVAKLVSVVAVIGEEKYASLADAIEAANALDSATIVLKADVTVDATQEITGNVTITDDGTARTITRDATFTGKMFVVDSDASFTLEATGTDKDNPTLTIDGNRSAEGASASEAMISLGTGSGTLTVNNAVQFTNANISEDGGIIRTEDGSTAIVMINGGVFANNTVSRTDAVYGGLINVLGTANVTISNAIFQENAISSTSKLVKGGMLYVNGGALNVVGSEFTSNTAYTTTAGGGLIRIDSGTLNIGKYVNEDKVTIEDACTFTSNAFSSSSGKNGYGGVIAVGDNASAQVYNSKFELNTAEYGNISVNGGATLTVGDCIFSDNSSTIATGMKDIRATGTSGKVVVEGYVITTVYCNNSNKLKVNSQLTEGSQIIVTGPSSVIKEGNTVATFASETIMTDCKNNGYLVLTNSGYALSYETSDSNYIAKLKAVE